MDLQHIDHQHLVYFYWVAKLMNFTKAAEQCRCSKSHISKAIAQLEFDLKAKLLQRTTRQLELTEAGEYLFKITSEMMLQLNDSLSRLQDITHQPHGHLKLSAPPALAEMMLAPIFGKFFKKHADISIHCDCESRKIDIVKEGYDAVFRNAKLEDSNYIARYLTDIQYVCVASKNICKEVAKAIKTPEDIQNFPTFAYDMPGGVQWVFEKGDQQKHIKLQPKLTSNLSMMVLAALESSKGIAVLPDFLIKKELKEKTLKKVLPSWHLRKIPLYLIYPSKEYMPLKNRVFIDFICDHFS